MLNTDDPSPYSFAPHYSASPPPLPQAPAHQSILLSPAEGCPLLQSHCHPSSQSQQTTVSDSPVQLFPPVNSGTNSETSGIRTSQNKYLYFFYLTCIFLFYISKFFIEVF